MIPLSDLKALCQQWASQDANIAAIALVGSYARGEAKDDSDVDLLVLTHRTFDPYFQNQAWLNRFGEPQDWMFEDYGAARSVRADFEWGEVEFCFATVLWASVPLDEGSRRVLSGGAEIWVDHDGSFSNALRIVREGPSS